MRKIVDQPKVLAKVREAQIKTGIYKCLAFFSALSLAENNALDFELKRDMVADFDKRLWKERDTLGTARLAFGPDGEVRSCPVPLYELTNGKTRLSHACGLSVAVVGGNGEYVLAHEKEDPEFISSMLPFCTFLTVNVDNHHREDYTPAISNFWEAVEKNFAELLQREGDLENVSYKIINTKLIEVDRPREHYQLAFVIELPEDAEAKLLQKGWKKQTKADIENLVQKLTPEDDASQVATLALAFGEEFFGQSCRLANLL